MFGEAFAPPPAPAAPAPHGAASAASTGESAHHHHGGRSDGGGEGHYGHAGMPPAAGGLAYGGGHDSSGAHGAAGGQVMARGVRNRELGFTAKARLPEREATQARIDIARTNLANVPRGVSDRQRDIGRRAGPYGWGRSQRRERCRCVREPAPAVLRGLRERPCATSLLCAPARPQTRFPAHPSALLSPRDRRRNSTRLMTHRQTLARRALSPGTPGDRTCEATAHG